MAPKLVAIVLTASGRATLGVFATAAMTFTIELERETDGRWIAEGPDRADVLSYGQAREEAVARVQALALRVIAERFEHAEGPPELLDVTLRAA